MIGTKPSAAPVPAAPAPEGWFPTLARLVAEENARRVRADPCLLDFARSHLDARAPEHSAGSNLWRRLLDAGSEAVASALTADTPAGDFVRETAPSFGALPALLRAAMVRRARAGR